MSRREQYDQLLERIDSVLSECGKDPRRQRPSRPPARPRWRGPSWLQAQSGPESSDRSRDGDHPT